MVGRPSKYDEAHCQVAEDTLAKGYSEAVLAGELGVCVDTITEWKNVHPDFSASIKRGRAKGAKVWEDRLILLAERNEGNATGIIFGLKNRQPEAWKDKTETEHSGGLKIEEIRRTVHDPRNPNR
jgi:hypothetical protein